MLDIHKGNIGYSNIQNSIVFFEHYYNHFNKEAYKSLIHLLYLFQ